MRSRTAFRVARAGAFALALGGCGAKMQAAPPSAASAPPVASAAPPAVASPAQPPPSTPPVAALSFERVPYEPSEGGADAHVEILFPFADQLLAPDKARKFVIRTKLEGWKSELVDFSLDDFVPRRADTLPTPLRLEHLVPEDAELAKGEHLLVATAVHEDGRLVRSARARSRAPFAAVRFWVGERVTPAPNADAPLLVYRQPRGTYNGEAADRVLVDFLLLGASLGESLGVRATIGGQNASGATLVREPGALLVRDVPNGDFSIEITLVGADDKPVSASKRRTITVNRDAPKPGAKRP